MRFARKDELDRALPVIGQFHHILELLEDEWRAFVGGKTAGGANRGRVWFHKMIECDEIPRGGGVALGEQGGGGGNEQFPPAAGGGGPPVPHSQEIPSRPA